jgi:aspartate racemase
LRRLGIVGGIAPASTIEYYRKLIAGVRARTGEAEYPHVIINSINLREMLPYFEAGDAVGARRLLSREVQRLADAGAELGMFASNTPQLHFDAIAADAPIPLVSIVDAVSAEAVRLGLKKVLLLGTGFTMRATFYSDGLAKSGIAVTTPDGAELDRLHEHYMSHLVSGRFTTDGQTLFETVISRMLRADRIDGVILGGTELPILLQASEFEGIPLLDSGELHVQTALDRMYA